MVQDLSLPNAAGFLSSFPAQILIWKHSTSPPPTARSWKDRVCIHFLTTLQQRVLSWTPKAVALLLPWLQITRRWEIRQQQDRNALALVLCSSLAISCRLLPGTRCEMGWTLALSRYRRACLLPGSCSALEKAFSFAFEIKALVKNGVASACLLQL